MDPCKRPIQVIRRTLSSTAKLKVYYPNVLNLPNIQVQRYINLMTQGLPQKMLWDAGFWSEPAMSYHGEYKVKLNEKCLFSANQINNQYVKGAAHGLTVMKSVNTDIRTGKLLQLSDLLTTGEWQDKINAIIKEEFKERDYPALTEFETIGDNPDFYLTPDSLVIYFQAYEYTPYAVGLPEFSIPYTELQPFIGPDSPLVPFL